MIEAINKFLNKFVGNKYDRDLKDLQPYVGRINAEFDKLTSITNDELRAKTTEFRERITSHYKTETDQIQKLNDRIENEPDLGIAEREAIYAEVDELQEVITEKIEEACEEILPEAFAVMKETARRFKENDAVEVSATDWERKMSINRPHLTIKDDKASWSTSWDAAGAAINWDMVHYDVQLIGGVVLHQGKIAEMATGEGKTLVATLPVYLNALPGRGVHVVTVNDYLARRDAQWMAPLFEFHGLSIECIDNFQPNSDDRKRAYLSDITYGTNNEFGFDYLRDNGASSPDDLVQRKHNYAIVDEVDSVLIDDARTPLIISGPTPKGDQQEYLGLKPRIERLVDVQKKATQGFLTEAKKKLAEPGEGVSKKEAGQMGKEGGMALLRAFRGLPKNKALIKYLSEPGVKQDLQKTENYYLADQEKEMHKVDAELYFTIDEKSNAVNLTDKGLEFLSAGMDDPDFFVMPDISVGIKNLEDNHEGEELIKAKDELLSDYSEKADRVHSVTQLLKAYSLFEKDVEYVVMDNKVKIVDEQTGRIMDGRRYSDGLHQAIEAKENVKVEAATQTYATVTLQNYFRMYNKLSGMTGTAETEAGEFYEIYKLDVVVIPTNRPIARDDQQDLIFKTEREKYNQVIDEVVKMREAGRPTLVGTTSVEISELLGRTLKMRKIPHQVLNAKLHQSEAAVVAKAGEAGTVTIATNMAGRGTDIKLSDEVKAAGGLAIIGTERHDSRRVDRQLRGRSGRQGDPGSSLFYVSLEDNLMRLFMSDRVAKLMDRLGMKEGEVIQHPWVTKSIERAQKKVEENNFGIRKRLLEYDDVMNSQREVIYERRRNALFGERMGLEIGNAMQEVCFNLAEELQETRDFELFELEILKTLAIQSPLTEAEFMSMSPKAIGDRLFEIAQNAYKRKAEIIGEMAHPVIKNVYENEASRYENIVIPFNDGKRAINVVTNLKKAYESTGVELTKSLEKSIVLATIDQHWKEHLREMDDLRQSVQGAVYEQKDPLLIYKFESFELFQRMLGMVNREVVSFIMRATLPQQQENAVQEAKTQRQDLSQLTASRTDTMAAAPQPQGRPGEGGLPEDQRRQKPQQVVRTERKIGRNERVEIRNIMTGETKKVKFKVAEPLVAKNEWEVLEVLEA